MTFSCAFACHICRWTKVLQVAVFDTTNMSAKWDKKNSRGLPHYFFISLYIMCYYSHVRCHNLTKEYIDLPMNAIHMQSMSAECGHNLSNKFGLTPNFRDGQERFFRSGWIGLHPDGLGLLLRWYAGAGLRPDSYYLLTLRAISSRIGRRPEGTGLLLRQYAGAESGVSLQHFYDCTIHYSQMCYHNLMKFYP